MLKLILALTLSALTTADVCMSASCGIKPLKPLVPLGCDDLAAQCVCDAKGKNCSWTWVCVKKKR